MRFGFYAYVFYFIILVFSELLLGRSREKSKECNIYRNIYTY